MSLSKRLAAFLVFIWMIVNLTAPAANAGIGCPSVHHDRVLEDVELFDGPPSNKIEVMPKDGRFVVPQTPKSLWHRYPHSTLGCTYRGSKEMITVVLPRDIRVCEFKHFPHVDCH